MINYIMPFSGKIYIKDYFLIFLMVIIIIILAKNFKPKTMAVTPILDTRAIPKGGGKIPSVFDIVITWVDWSYPEFAINIHNEKPAKGTFTELKYLLRSIIKSKIPFRKIFVVHSDYHPPPNYIKINHSNLHLIKHSQIVKDPSHMPLTTRQSIYINLHRIPGLSENFLFMEDDYLIMEYNKNLIFDNTKIKGFFKSKLKLKPNDPMGLWFNSSKHSTEIFVGHPLKNTESYLVMGHAAMYLQKSIIENLEARFPEAFSETSKFKKFNGDWNQYSKIIDLTCLYAVYLNIEKKLPIDTSKDYWSELHTNEKKLLPKNEIPAETQIIIVKNILELAPTKPFFNYQGPGISGEYNDCKIYRNIVYTWLEKQFPTKSQFEITK